MDRKNRILQRLPAAEFALISPLLEPVVLPLRERLEISNRPIGHVYFIEEGVVSVVATGPRRKVTEVGLIGNEGCTGQTIILASTQSPLDSHMQIAGHGQRIATADLIKVMRRSQHLQTLLHRSVQVFNLQVAFTALANAQANLDQRLARWLLMAQDRVASDVITLTHEFIAVMLGVRRAGVTEALARLKAAKLLKTKRGAIVVVDRAGLRKLADRFYGTPEAELERIFD